MLACLLKFIKRGLGTIIKSCDTIISGNTTDTPFFSFFEWGGGIFYVLLAARCRARHSGPRKWCRPVAHPGGHFRNPMMRDSRTSRNARAAGLPVTISLDDGLDEGQRGAAGRTRERAGTRTPSRTPSKDYGTVSRSVTERDLGAPRAIHVHRGHRSRE